MFLQLVKVIHVQVFNVISKLKKKEKEVAIIRKIAMRQNARQIVLIVMMPILIQLFIELIDIDILLKYCHI